MKQQKLIQKFINDELLNQKIFLLQNKILLDIIKNTKNKTPNQIKTLNNTILPRIALYKALNEFYSQDEAYSIVKKYMYEVIGKNKNKSMKIMEKVPCFYFLYSKIFIHIMKTTDLQKSNIEYNKKYYNVTITKCLWHDACVENGCPELCRLFCDVDNITYDGLKKIGFSRTKTLGYGNDKCDFHFYKKSRN